MTHQQLVVGTTNQAKVNQLKAALASLPLEIRGLPSDAAMPTIAETGKTVEENATLKATTYSKLLKLPVIAMDYALYLDGLTPDKQPGLNIRQINKVNTEPTDEEIVEYYSTLIASLGNKVSGHWLNGICIAAPQHIMSSTTINIPRVYVAKPSPTRIPGYPLASLQIEPTTGEYLSDIITRTGDHFWQQSVGQQIKTFVQQAQQELAF